MSQHPPIQFYDEVRDPLVANAPGALLSPTLMAKLEKMELVSRKIFRGRMKGERRSHRKGQSVEFADYRAYVPGDDLRFMDWNLFARLDRLFLKLFLEEEDLRLFILLDNTVSMSFGDPSKLAFAQQVAAALGFVALCRSDRIQIGSLLPQPTDDFRPIRGRPSVWRLLQQLEQISPAENTSLSNGILRFLQRCTGRGILILISDLLEKDGFERSLKHLIARDMDIFVIHVLSREELQPSLSGDLRLVDAEDQDVTDLSVTRSVLEQYDQTVAAFLHRSKSFCHKHGIGYVFSDTHTRIEALVQGHLARRGLVR